MRTAKLDECFNDPEEREFLRELSEQALGEAHETLAQHREEDLDPLAPDSYIANIDRQRRRIKFLELLHESLEEGG